MHHASGKVGVFAATPVTQPAAATDLGVVLSDLGLRVAGTAYPISTSGNIAITSAVNEQSKLTKYNAIATVNNGLPSQVATSTLTNQTAAIAATTIYAIPADGAGFYRVNFYATVNRAATTSSTLGGTIGCQITHTVGAVAKVTTPAAVTQMTSTTNNTGTAAVAGSILVYCDASTNLQYAFGYTSSGATTMRYNLYLTVEKL
jgi:hypothetical protein